MCCCDCLLVAALIDAAKSPVPQPLGASQHGIRSPDHIVAVSTDRVPTRLCGWSMLALLHRRWHKPEVGQQ